MSSPTPHPAKPSDARADATRSVSDLLALAVQAVGGSARDGQLRMADAIEEAVADGRHLLVQAGTGTGKSLAYLAPAVRHAVVTKKPVVISTATLALQYQLVNRDIPAVTSVWSDAVGRSVKTQLVKGRSNYVCLHKLEGGYPSDDEPEQLPLLPGRVIGDAGPSRLGEQVTRLREWAQDTTTGDRDELDPGVSDLAWRQVSVTARECLGASACPRATECFCELARAGAASADVVVTNHALLAIDAFEGRSILPEHDVLIVDEAHELSERVTNVAAQQISPDGLRKMLSMARKSVGAAGVLSDAVDDVIAVSATAAEGRVVGELAEPLVAALTRLLSACRTAFSDIGPANAQDDANTAASKKLARAAVSDVGVVAERILEQSEFDVVWAARDYRASPSDPVTWHVAPITVGGLLREKLFDTRTVVLTSATLTIGGTFEAVATGVGLARSADGETSGSNWAGLDVGSPFEYSKQGMLYIARHLAAPTRSGLSEEQLDELTDLVTAAGGRTLGLFSSRAAAEVAAERVRASTGLPVLCQGDDAMPVLVRNFAQQEQVSLFGTLTLWQGVDVPGATSSLVVIDRIPFPRPDNPLMAARSDAVARRGGNGFMAVSAQHAALLMAQGAGRLIRSVHDRGVLAVLDSRIATKSYGQYFVRSMPPMWPTNDPQLVRSALRRLSGQAQS